MCQTHFFLQLNHFLKQLGNVVLNKCYLNMSNGAFVRDDFQLWINMLCCASECPQDVELTKNKQSPMQLRLTGGF